MYFVCHLGYHECPSFITLIFEVRMYLPLVSLVHEITNRKHSCEVFVISIYLGTIVILRCTFRNHGNCLLYNLKLVFGKMSYLKDLLSMTLMNIGSKHKIND